MEEVRHIIVSGHKERYLLEGTQSLPVRPSDEGSMKLKATGLPFTTLLL
jgi:hypothetical protein